MFMQALTKKCVHSKIILLKIAVYQKGKCSHDDTNTFHYLSRRQLNSLKQNSKIETHLFYLPQLQELPLQDLLDQYSAPVPLDQPYNCERYIEFMV